MTKEEIEHQIANWQNADYLAAYFAQNQGELENLLEVVFDDSNKRNWIAAWVLDKLNDKNPELLQSILPRIAQQVYQTQNHSKLRHYLKILSLHRLPTELSGELFEHCFSTFTNPTFAVAIRVHAMQILYEISQTEPDLKPELIHLIENELEIHPSPGIKSRGKRLLSLLRNQIMR